MDKDLKTQNRSPVYSKRVAIVALFHYTNVGALKAEVYFHLKILLTVRYIK